MTAVSLLRAAVVSLALSAPAATLNVRLGPDDTGPEAPIALHFERRLTVVMPDPVRLAVPGSHDVVSTHVRENVVVAALVDSPEVRRRRPTTNLTVLTEAGVVFTCRLTVAARQEEAEVDVVEVHVVRPPAAPPPKPVGDPRPSLARWAAEGLAVAGEVARDRSSFIYLVSHGAARIGPVWVLRLGVRNHSRPPFRIGRVRVAGTDAVWHAAEAVVPPDARERSLGVVASAPSPDEPLVVEVCEAAPGERCVSVRPR